MHANWDILYPNCEWSSWDIEGPSMRRKLELPNKHRARMEFLLYFFQRFWDLVKPNILSLFNQLFNGAVDLRCLNYTLVALIPKKEGASIVNEF